MLLPADEQKAIINRYLECRAMCVPEEGGIEGECVVTHEGDDVLELKNIAVKPAFQGKGYGKALSAAGVFLMLGI